MYAEYWGMQRVPFDHGNDPELFFRSNTHQAALLKLKYLAENRLGAGLLVGAVGTGKTCVADLLAHEIGDRYAPVVHVVFPQLTTAELLAYIALELGADESEVGRGDTGVDLSVRAIERQLIEHSRHGQHPLLIVDEAHLVENPRVFLALQLLLNFQGRGCEFSLILVGERNLIPQVRRIAQLDERIGVRCLLQPLGRDETAAYIEHRTTACGGAGPIFEPDAVQAIFEQSGGIPRRINRLCDLALLVGYADGLSEITAGEIAAVADELVAVVAD